MALFILSKVIVNMYKVRTNAINALRDPLVQGRFPLRQRLSVTNNYKIRVRTCEQEKIERDSSKRGEKKICGCFYERR